jgi:hypothetical protein
MEDTKRNTKTLLTTVGLWAFIIASMSFVMFSGFNVGMKLTGGFNNTEPAGCTCNNDVQGEAKVITEEMLDKLLAIAGVKVDGKNIDYEVIFLNGNTEVSKVPLKNKAFMIYKYAEYNNMLEYVSGEVYPFCKNINGYCQAISVDNYNKIAKLYGIKDDPNLMFDAKMIFDNKYLYVYNKPAQTVTYTHDYSASFDNNDIVIIDNVSGVVINSKNYITKEVTYRFKLDDQNNYYLFSVSSK